jgi:ATP-dependent NAD(P)H-hydrate dehydratase
MKSSLSLGKIGDILEKELSSLFPVLTNSRIKGENGKIGVIGGSFEYTVAPYYSATAALRGGADLTHIFCSEKAGTAVKSYSPEIIVHPCLECSNELDRDKKQKMKSDENFAKKLKNECVADMIDSVTKWYPALHSIVIGSGLGRDDFIAETLPDIINKMQSEHIAVFDADFFWYLSGHDIKEKLREALTKRAEMCILTPNIAEFGRLWKYVCKDEQAEDTKKIQEAVSDLKEAEIVIKMEKDNIIVKDVVKLSQKLNNITIIQKGQVDVITDGKDAYVVNQTGGGKRCGGQGDILGGLAALYSFWAFSSGKQNKNLKLLHGCILASLICRKSSQAAFDIERYGLTSPMIIDQLGKTTNLFADILSNKGALPESKL